MRPSGGKLPAPALRCEQCHAEKLVAFSCKKRGFCPSRAARRLLLATRPAVLSAVLGVVYRTIPGHLLTRAGLTRRTGHTGAVTLIQRIAERLARMLEKRGLSKRDAERAWLSADPDRRGSLDDQIGHSITYRIAVGPRAGQEVFTLQSVAAQPEGGRARRCCRGAWLRRSLSR